MQWGKGNRFNSKTMFHLGPEAIADRDREPKGPSLVNFSAYLKQQYLHSKGLFKNSSIWAENSAEIPVSRPSKGGKTKGKRIGKGKSKSKKGSKKHKDSTVVNDAADNRQRIDLEHLPESEDDYEEEEQHRIQSPPKLKPSKIIKKTIYTNHYINESDIPGPGTYNISGSLVKPSFNRVYAEPPYRAYSNSLSAPSYLRPTSASLFKKFDPPCSERSAMIDSPTKYAMQSSIKNFKSQARASSPKQLPASPFNPQFPPVSNTTIKRWSSEHNQSYSKGRRPHSPIDRSKVRQNVTSFWT